MRDHLMHTENDELPKLGELVRPLVPLQIDPLLDDAFVSQAAQRLGEDVVVTIPQQRFQIRVPLRLAYQVLQDPPVHRGLLIQKAKRNLVFDILWGQRERLRDSTPFGM